MKEIIPNLQSQQETSVVIPEGQQVVLKFDPDNIVSNSVLKIDLSEASQDLKLKFENLRTKGTNLVVFEGERQEVALETSGCKFESFFAGNFKLKLNSTRQRTGNASINIGSISIELSESRPTSISIDDFSNRRTFNSNSGARGDLDRLLQSLNSDIILKIKQNLRARQCLLPRD